MIGIVLAGGRASRMGGEEKSFLRVGGITMIERILGILRPQCDTILINANGDPARFSAFGHEVIRDDLPDRPGPLAGLLAGLDYVAAHHSEAGFVLSVPGDAPFLPRDLLARLEDRRVADRAAIVRAGSDSSGYGVAALWSVALRADLRRALVDEGMRKVGAFVARHSHAGVTWPARPVDPFFNVNSPEDLAAAERAAGGPAAGL